MKVLKWVLLNGLFGVAVYFGFIEGHEGAYNAAMFVAWVSIVCSFLLLADPVIEKMKETGRTMPAWINISFDAVITITFVWFGAWVTGGFYLLHIALTEAAWSKAAES